jgi:hypothetical protein
VRSPLEDSPIGGFGIHLMRQFATRIEYQRACERNQLSLFFVEPSSASNDGR